MFTSSSPLTLFPLYLLPSTPFHKRKTSTDTTDSTNSSHSTTTPTSPLPSDNYLSGHKSHLRCAKCASDICFTSQIISKGFTGRHGRAYLVSPSPLSAAISSTAYSNKHLCLPNTKTDAPSQRQLVTGAHTVSDVHCAFCNSMLGWKYDEAEEESQRYKVGKYILETKMVASSSNWDLDDMQMPPFTLQSKDLDRVKDDAVEFDSEDEDECEDLFSGVWSSGLAMRRRQNKSFRRAMVGSATDGGSKQR